ncbi:response regulator [Hwanghaeella grinnelliae]|nr:response regulator [Hwanghaeella grinnelliae]
MESDQPDGRELRDAIEQYAALTDGWFWESDEEHKITYVSQGVEDIVGSPPSFFIGRSRKEYSIASSVDAEVWEKHIQDLSEKRAIHNFTYKFQGPKGERWIRVDGTPVFSKAGRFLGYRGIARDITDQVSNENRVAMLAAAVDQFPSPICIWGEDDKLLWFNKPFQNSFADLPIPVEIGIGYETFIRQLAETRLAWKNDRECEEWISARIEGQRTQQDTATVRLQNGRTFRIEKRPLSSGETVTLSMELTDILSAQDEAQIARRKLTEALNALDTPFAYYDAEDRLQNWNDAFTEMNIKISDLLTEGAPFEYLLDALIERGQIAGIEGREEEFRRRRLESHRQSNIRTERQIGDGRWFMAREVGTSDGGVVGIWTDISELKAQQAELEHGRKEAERASQLKSGFLANISHELRTPLNSIGGFVHLLAERDLGEQEQQLVSRISSSTDMLVSLVNDLLDLSLAEAGELHVTNSEFSIPDVLDEVARILEPVASIKGLTFETDVADEFPAVVCGDRMRIRQILLSFADNAVKFTHKGGIRISARAEGGVIPTNDETATIFLEVSDTGIGIADDVTREVFTPFFQGDGSSTREFGGAGLGLSISKKLADLMGGSIEIDSVIGTGTTVTLRVRLPIHSTVGLGESPPPTARGLSGAKILVVDDQSLNRQVLRSVLTRAGCSVYEAVDGEEAVNIALSSEAHFFDAILMDIQMPKMDGLTATRAILATAKGNVPPIIALTAHTMESERRKCIAAGMCDHLEKPVDPVQLFDTLARWTSGRREGASISPGQCEHSDGTNLDVKPEPLQPAEASAASVYVALVHQLADAIDDEELARELLGEFAETYGNAAAQLRSYLDADEVTAAKDFAHRLKGVSGNLRLIDLHDAAMRLEARLSSNPQHSDELYEALDTLGAIHNRIVDSIHGSVTA